MKLFYSPLVFLLISFPVFSQEIGLVCIGKESTLIQNKVSERSLEKSYVLKGEKLIEDDFVIDCKVNPSLIKCFKEHETSKTTWNITIDRVTGKIDIFSTNPSSTFVNEFKGICKKVNKVF